MIVTAATTIILAVLALWLITRPLAWLTCWLVRLFTEG